jgi:hypothetical protein
MGASPIALERPSELLVKLESGSDIFEAASAPEQQRQEECHAIV